MMWTNGAKIETSIRQQYLFKSHKVVPDQFSIWNHFSEQLSTRRSWPAFETLLLHLKQKCSLSFVQPPPPPPPPPPTNPQKIPKNCDVFLETSFTISFFFLFSYLGNNRDLYQLPLDVFDGVPLSYLWVLAYSYFEKGCRKKCTRQYRKVLWVVLSSLFFKEI